MTGGGKVKPAPQDEVEDEDVELAEKRSTRSAGKGGGGWRDTAKSQSASEAQSQFASLISTEETRLSELANLDLKYKNECVRRWIHSKVSIRLMLMLTTPFVALIILLVIVISGEVENNAVASNIITLANLAQESLFVVAELSAEYTCSLWWILDETLQSGITETTGGLKKTGYAGQVAVTDSKIGPLTQFVATNSISSISERLSDQLSVILSSLQSIPDMRYNVMKFRVNEAGVTEYYVALLDGLLEVVDLTATLADARTVQAAQSMISWSRTKTAVERERHTAGMILLLKHYSLQHYTDWLAQVALQDQWRSRFLTIAPDEMLDRAKAYFTGDEMRHFEELRLQGNNAFVPEDPTVVPDVNFDEWMTSAGNVIEFMRVFRANITKEIIQIANDGKSQASTALALYILLAALTAGLSITIAILVGWSVEAPWNAMMRMKERMFIKLDEQDKRNLIVNQFVPTEFLAMMGLKSLFDLQLGNCMLKRATILCSEIRNFSKLSERMAPQQNFQFLSMWLQDSGPIIRRHGGFIEKFRGNGLTSIFSDPNDALDAGLELLESAHSRNQEASNASLQIDLGIAIHTGDLMLGTVGDQQRMETAVISEALAIALLITSLTTLYQASMLLSRETFMVLNVEGVSIRFLGESGVHGLHLRPQVYEVLQPSDESKLDTLNEFNQAMKLHQNNDFDGAANLYKSVLTMDPNDIVSQRRLALAEKHEWVDMTGGH